ncbi:hypothetical protein DESUT3_20410 [Desulfuromonas versatilis]|uniref:GerMN domain-containing protein n=1 Tax=Desulfuromonas versatilis TaxID=2802975 RepID=A0ABM8HSN7_9BACT|nr:GerMN domain-containing protein [Desulfuromonas versatilis]BCR04972.1 hypothetical protein DESUT3_20410 [Desulfuromonas versatilis]
MNKVFHIALAVILAGAVLAASGCRRGDQQPAREGRITATAVYETHFGEAPNPQEGACFALVGFLPAATQEGKVVPLPLFLFKQEEQMRQLVERLITVDEGAAARVGVASPFAENTTLLGLRQQEDTVIVDLTGQGDLAAEPQRARLILAALGHSLVQFPGVAKLIVTASGNPLPGSEAGYVPSPEDVAAPGNPVVLGVLASWEQQRPAPEEVSVYFDRPVTIQQIQLTDQAGNRIEGEYFQSIFNMAVVIHPPATQSVSEGMPVRVAWEVTDFKGRSSKGDQMFQLMRMEHP